MFKDAEIDDEYNEEEHSEHEEEEEAHVEY